MDRRGGVSVMTDLEMTRLCAEAMGYSIRRSGTGNARVFVPGVTTDRQGGPVEDGQAYVNSGFDPLTNDAQAMALVKHCRLNVFSSSEFNGQWEPRWRVVGGYRNSTGALLHEIDAWGPDLNRAIVECVSSKAV